MVSRRESNIGMDPIVKQRTKKLQELQDDIVDGLHQVDDERQSFFARGRELESVGDAHTYADASA